MSEATALPTEPQPLPQLKHVLDEDDLTGIVFTLLPFYIELLLRLSNGFQ